MGVVLYRCLSGALPFSGQAAAVLHQVTHDAPIPLDRIAPATGLRLAAAVQRALVRDLDVRYRDTRELARALLCTAVVDGVSLPDDPDPVGLPEWPAWRLEAERAVDRTLQSLAVIEPPVRSVRRRSYRWAVLALLALGGALAAWMVKGDAVRASVVAQTRSHASAAASADPHGDLRQIAIAPVLQPEPQGVSALESEQPGREPSRRIKPDRGRSRPHSASSRPALEAKQEGTASAGQVATIAEPEPTPAASLAPTPPPVDHELELSPW
jgi:hypothetical protein